MQRTIERLRCKMGKTHRALVAGVLVLGVLLALFTVLLSVDVVTIADDAGTQQTVMTTANRQAADILQLAGVETSPNDEVTFTADVPGARAITVDRSFNVSVVVDGSQLTSSHENGATVADALAACGVMLGTEDVVTPAADELLVRNMDIAVCRVTYLEESGRYEVPADKVESYTAALLAQDENAQFTESKSRIYDVTYSHRLENGEIVASEVVALEAVYHPYDEPSAAFEPGVPVSTIDGFAGVEIGADGIPTSYTRKLESAVATAYSASGGRGAGGQGLYCGTVAVNPNVIPYGTRLYIAAADGSFIYGYAIASDCGIAMMDGRVDVDLYFETNAECLRFGKRALDVYILD